MSAFPHQTPDSSGLRAGGGAADAATDPWGVRRAENLLTSLEGVLSARVVTTPMGEVSEIHILASNGQTPKNVVRNVESALLAHLGLRVDHRKISIAQTAEVRPLAALEASAVHAGANQRSVLFDDLVVASGPRTRRMSATVTLTCAGRIESAMEEGADTQRSRVETAAKATLAVLELLVEKGSLALEGSQQVEAFDKKWVMVGVQAMGGRESKLLVGSAEVRESPEHAAVYAVLDATNRWVSARRNML